MGPAKKMMIRGWGLGWEKVSADHRSIRSQSTLGSEMDLLAFMDSRALKFSSSGSGTTSVGASGSLAEEKRLLFWSIQARYSRYGLLSGRRRRRSTGKSILFLFSFLRGRLFCHGMKVDECRFTIINKVYSISRQKCNRCNTLTITDHEQGTGRNLNT